MVFKLTSGIVFSDGSLESPHDQQSEHVSRSRTRDMEDFHGESSSGQRRVSDGILFCHSRKMMVVIKFVKF